MSNIILKNRCKRIENPDNTEKQLIIYIRHDHGTTAIIETLNTILSKDGLPHITMIFFQLNVD